MNGTRGMGLVACVEVIIVMEAWLMWYTRNSTVHDNAPWLAGSIIYKTEGLLVEHRAVNLSLQSSLKCHSFKWELPPFEYFKVNFEASWTKEQNGVGVRVVIRDNRGEFYVGLSKLGQRVSSVAALEAINFALDAEFRDIML